MSEQPGERNGGGEEGEEGRLGCAWGQKDVERSVGGDSARQIHARTYEIFWHENLCLWSTKAKGGPCGSSWWSVAAEETQKKEKKEDWAARGNERNWSAALEELQKKEKKEKKEAWNKRKMREAPEETEKKEKEEACGSNWWSAAPEETQRAKYTHECTKN